MKSRLTEQITYLLLRHAYVVVPQLGGFLCEVAPASYDPQRRVALPPRAELHFSAEMSHSDGLLEERYALLLGTSLRRARLVLEEEVRQLRQALVQHRSYELGGIGTLLMSDEGTLSFAPAERTLATEAYAYGYTPLSLPELAQRTDLPTVASEGSRSDDRYLSLRIPKRALGYAASLVLLILALLPWGNSVGESKGYQAGFAPTAEMAEQLFGKAPASPAKAQEATPSTPPSSTLRWSEEADGRFHIILATERQPERITSHYERLRGELPEATAFTALGAGKGRMIRLSVASFATSAEAYAYLQALTKAYASCRGAWVYASK